MSYSKNSYPLLTAHGAPFTDFGDVIHINHAVDVQWVDVISVRDVFVRKGETEFPTFDIRFANILAKTQTVWKFLTAEVRDEYFAKVKEVLTDAYVHHLGG